MRRRLNGRCKGLLEVISGEAANGDGSKYVGQFHAPKVVFNHRIVRDFLYTKDMQNMLLENLEADFEPKLCFCKALLTQFKALDYGALKGSNWLPSELLEDLAYYTSRLEYEVHVPQSSLLDDVSRCVSKHASLFGWENGEKDFLGFLIRRRLHLYIREILTTRTSLTLSDKSVLLANCLKFLATKYHAARYDMMIDILLRHGAQPNNKYKDSTVWGHFLLSITKCRSQLNQDEGLIIESLLFHGANPQERIVTGQKTRTRAVTGRAADLHRRQEVQVDITKSALGILVELWGKEKTSDLLKKVRKDQTAQPSRLKWWSG